MPLIEANGLRFDIDFDLAGDPGAPIVMLIMGLGMPAAAWPESFVAPLRAAGLRVLRFDNRDCGQSSQTGNAQVPSVLPAIVRTLLRRPVHATYTLDDMAADAVAILDSLAVANVHVVGASMGGMIAQVLAARYPDRVRSLTSIMSSTGNPSRRIAFGERRALGAILQRPTRTDDPEALVVHLMRVFDVIGSPGFRASPEALRAQLLPVALRGYYPAGTARQLLAILASGDRRPLLAQVVAPTLVIHGADDPLVPLAAGLDTARHIRDARLEVIPGMGHDFAPALQPRLARLVVDHVRSAVPLGTTAT
jgi:pimeloyl-ACP methyl ester carboxylesterase